MYETQNKKIVKYLKSKRGKGATNFEMITRLHILDTRKRISEINNNPELYGGYIMSEWEENEKARYKRYYWIKYENK